MTKYRIIVLRLSDFVLKKMHYPQYRKLAGFDRYYKITDDKCFIEVAVTNGKASSQTIIANQFPEMLRIQDMLNCNWSYVKMNDEEIDNYFKTEQ